MLCSFFCWLLKFSRFYRFLCFLSQTVLRMTESWRTMKMIVERLALLGL